jgi:putative endopeptidase
MTKLFKWHTLAGMLLMAGFITACSTKDNGNNKKPEFSVTNMDTTVVPGNDFFEYVNGGWLKKNKIPASKSSYGIISKIHDHNQDILKEIVTEASDTSGQRDSIQTMVGDFYISGMDTTHIEELGYAPIKPLLNQIRNMKSRKDVPGMLAELRKREMGTLYGTDVDQDAKHSDQYAIYINQGGIGLPDRDYYLDKSAHYKKIREQYLQHIATMFQLIGVDSVTAVKNAHEIMKLETNLAEHSMTRVERRDPDKTYHKMTISELNKLTPQFDWASQLQALGVRDENNVIVSQPDFVKNMNQVIKTTPLEVWKDYFTWDVLRHTSSYLSKPFEEAHFKFYGTILQGRKAMEKRWKRVVETIDGNIGMALGQMYVKKAFPPEAKRQVNEMVQHLKEAFREQIKDLDWMSEATKQKALEKLDKYLVQIGYPDKWIDYSSVTIKPGDYLGNVIRASEFDFQRNIHKLGKPVDRHEWFMTPQTVNAYNNPTMNEVVFPAGILQPPFFDPNAEAALNYGAIGVVIGHEMTHGFDDEGRKYDSNGNLNNWWTKEDQKKFEERAEKVAQEYDQFTVLDSLHVNGKLTLGENIADQGGLLLAHNALLKYYQAHGNPGNVDGFTPDQRFYLAYARVWRAKYTPELQSMLIKVDPHSPPKYRVNGNVVNMAPWYKAFDVTPNDSMYVAPDKRALVW